MRKALLTLITGLIALPTMAQYEEAGYYRIRNLGAAQRYISLVNNKVESEFKTLSVTSLYQPRSVEALATIKDPKTDPGTIFYISGSKSDVVLEAQGMNTQKLLGDKYHLALSGTTLSSEYQGQMVYMIDNYEGIVSQNAQVSVALSKIASEAGAYRQWSIEKVDNNKEYIGIKPDFQIGDKYYSTMYTSFPYALSEGMKAYYIDNHEYSDKKVLEPVAELVTIKGNIPAAMPVIIECSSNTPEDNKILPILPGNAPASIKGNQLKGLYFCYYLGVGSKESTNSVAKELKNVREYDEKTMRVLSSVDGKLALIPASDADLTVSDKGKYLKANRAYFVIKAEEAETTKNGILLLEKDDYAKALSVDIPNGISTATTDATKSTIVTLTGVRIKNGTSKDELPSGVYIIDGKKVIVK